MTNKLEGKMVKTENKTYGLILCTLLVLCFSILVPTYFLIKNEFIDFIRDRLIANATAAALAYDGDIIETITIENQANKAAEISSFQKINSRLESIHPDIKFVYVMNKNAKGEIVFLVDSVTIDRNGDGKIADDEMSAPIGEVYKNPTKEMQDAFIHPTADKEINQDRWGTFLSGYAPIFNSKNQTVAIVGLDMQSSVVQNKLNVFYLIGLSAFGLAIVFSILLSWWLQKKISKLNFK